VTSEDLTYQESGGPGSHDYEVRRGDEVVGRVERFVMGAGQFGATWAATRADSGAQQTGFPTREAAAAWLVDLPDEDRA
jgi:hypothetical protein